MPYITHEARIRLDAGAFPQTAGELNFAITRLIDTYLQGKRYDAATLTWGKLRYEHINEVVGVLECAKQELYRRIAAPYEDKKAAENGDVYTHE